MHDEPGSSIQPARRHAIPPRALIAPTTVGGKLRLTLLLVLAMAAANLAVSHWTASRLELHAKEIREAFGQRSLTWEIQRRVEAVLGDLLAAGPEGVPRVDSTLAAVRREGIVAHRLATEGTLDSSPEVAKAFHRIRDVTDSLFDDWGRLLLARAETERATWTARSGANAELLLGTLLPRAMDEESTRLSAAQRAFDADTAYGSRLHWIVFLASGILTALVLWTLVGGLSPRLRRLEQAASRLGAGELDERVPVDARDELADVARAFNSMAERLSATLLEHGKAEERLRESESRFRQLFEYGSDALYLHDLDGRIVAVNRQACEMLDYSRDELLGMPVFDIVSSLLRQDLEASWDSMRPGDFRSVEAVHRRKDGSEVPVDVRTTMLELDGRRRVLAAVRDLTERRRLEQQLLQATKLEAVGQLAGGIAHDFNNVLTAIRGHCQLALEEIDADDPLHRELTHIDRSAARAAELVLQLLAFSRRQVLQPRAVHPSEIVRGMQPMLRRVIDENIVLEVTKDDDVGLVWVDPGQLEQVVLNLVINAKDAMPSGGKLEIELRNEHVAERIEEDFAEPVDPGSYVRLSIRDTGEGIAEDVLPRIFEPFFTTKPVGKGSGLGLATVYGIVKQSGGSIQVRSMDGGGTKFDVRLPRVGETDEWGAVLSDGSEWAAGTRLEGRTILVVEDEEPVRDVVRRVLERDGCRVLVAADGVEALQVLGPLDGELDLMITDVVMPGVGGAELARRVSSLEPDLPILFMSGYARDELSQGVAEERLIEKPFTPADLVLKVQEILTSG